MKMARVSIDGDRYLICCPIGVLKRIEDYMNLDSTGDEFIDAVQTLYFMIEAGAKYADKKGIKNPPLPLLNDLMDTIDIEDFARIQSQVENTITESYQTEVCVSTKEQKTMQGI